MSDVFISYAREDRPKAQLIAEGLEQRGWSVWWDREIVAGEIFREVIERELMKAGCVVVLWSESSVKSKWVIAEAERADERRAVIPVLLDKVAIPMPFSSIHAADLSTWDGAGLPEEFEKLHSGVVSRLRETAPPDKEGMPAIRKVPGAARIMRQPDASTESKKEEEDAAKKNEQITQVSLLRVLKAHSSQVFSVAFSPDGTLLASGAEEGLRIWRVETGEAIDVNNQSEYVLSIAFSPDGRQLVTGGVVNLWDVESGKRIRELSDEVTDLANSVAFFPDGSSVVAGYAEGNIKCWDVKSGRLLRHISGHKSLFSGKAVSSVAVSPDGRIIASAGDDGKVRLWDVKTGAQVREFSGHSPLFSPDGSKLAVGQGYPDEPFIALFDLQHGHQFFKLPDYPLAFTPDGGGLIGHTRPEVRVWDLKGREERLTWRNEDVDVRSLAVSPDGKLVAVGGMDGAIRLWRLPADT